MVAFGGIDPSDHCRYLAALADKTMIGRMSPRRRSRPIRRALTWSIIILVVGVLIWILNLLKRPAATVVDLSSDVSSKDAVQSVKLVGTYFSFEYPSDWRLNRHEQAAPPRYLERAQVTIGEPHPYRFVMAVETPTGPLEEIPAIQARRRDLNGQYDETTRTVDGQRVVEFIRRDGGFERTLFWIQRGRLYTVSLTSTIKTDGDAVFNQYVSSIILP